MTYGLPEGIRRKAIPMPVWIERIMHFGGMCACGCGQNLGTGEIEMDHEPALCFREWDPVAMDTIPGQNDPEYLFPKLAEHHLIKTRLDIAANAKAKRLAKPMRTKSYRPFRGWLNFKGDVVWAKR